MSKIFQLNIVKETQYVIKRPIKFNFLFYIQIFNGFLTTFQTRNVSPKIAQQWQTVNEK